MKTALLISDINEFVNNSLVEKLSETYEVRCFSVLVLANLKKSNFDSKEQIHNELISKGGIQTAVQNLLKAVNCKIDLAVGFSIGGFVLWKAALGKLKAINLYCISSTRLRYEIQKPNCYTKAIFGAKDVYVPTKMWFQKLKIEYQIIENEGHEFYKKEEQIMSLFFGEVY